jgi:hypothetical protein
MHLLRRRNGIPPGVLDRVAAEIRRQMPWAPRVLRWMGLLGLAGLCAASVHAVPSLVRGRIGWVSLACNTVPFAAMSLGLLAVWVRGRREGNRLIARVLLAYRRCPHCGYDIRALPEDPADGATVCPECGCAWLCPPESTATPGDAPESESAHARDGP